MSALVVSREQVEAWLARLEASGGPLPGEDVIQFWELGPQHAAAMVPPLLATLQNEASPLRELAARWLGRVGTGSVEVAEALADAMRSSDETLREAAAMAVGEVGCATDTVRERLLEHVRSDRELLRGFAAASLLLLAPQEPEALQVLRSAHESQNFAVRDWAGTSLANLFATVPSAIDDAIVFLDDDYDPTIEGIARALAEAPADAVVPRLLEVLRHGEPPAQAGALFVLREVGAKAHAFRGDIVDALITARAFEADRTIRRRAANVAQAVQLDAPVIVERLRALLCDGDDWVEEQAACALMSFPDLREEVKREAEAILR